MRLAASVHIFFLVYRGYAKWDKGWGRLQFWPTKRVAIVESEQEARRIGQELGLPLYHSAVRDKYDQRKDGKKVYYVERQAVIIWDEKKSQGGEPIYFAEGFAKFRRLKLRNPLKEMKKKRLRQGLLAKKRARKRR